jgi:HEAT repeat protein
MTRLTAALVASTALLWCGFSVAQTALADDQELRAAIDHLGDFDYDTRTAASSFVRRVPVEQGGPALAAAVIGHEDGYVRFRAMVLLVGFGGPMAKQAVLEVLDDPNDRLRAVAYGYFEHEPDPAMARALLQALDTETSEFVRPALIRAVAAHDGDPLVRERLVADVDRGVDFFRGGVIEALGDRRASYALDALMRVVAEPGPLQDDALLALTRIGDTRALAAVAALQGTDAEMEPMVSAAAAALGSDRDRHFQFVIESLRYAAAGEELDLVRSAAAGLGALAASGDAEAVQALFDVGVDAGVGPRDAIALVVGMLAMRDPAVLLAHLETRSDLPEAALVLRDGFDILDEDLEEERFFMSARTAFWAASEGARSRVVTEELIRVLEF